MEAERFTTFPGKCFRYVVSESGRVRHCPGRTTHTGRFVDSKGVAWTVDACDEHAQDARFQLAAVEARAHNFRVASSTRT